MAKADAILVEWFGDDDMINAVGIEIAALGKIGDAAKAAGFLITCARNLDGSNEVGTGFDEGLRCDDGGGEAALHVAGTATIDPAILNDALEGRLRPALADLDHIDMRVEMHTWPRCGAFAAGDDVEAWVEVAVAGGAEGADILHVKAAMGKALADEAGAGGISLTGWIDGGEADEILCQSDKVLPFVVNPFEQSLHFVASRRADSHAGNRGVLSRMGRNGRPVERKAWAMTAFCSVALIARRSLCSSVFAISLCPGANLIERLDDGEGLWIEGDLDQPCAVMRHDALEGCGEVLGSGDKLCRTTHGLGHGDEIGIDE